MNVSFFFTLVWELSQLVLDTSPRKNLFSCGVPELLCDWSEIKKCGQSGEVDIYSHFSALFVCTTLRWKIKLAEAVRNYEPLYNMS